MKFALSLVVFVTLIIYIECSPQYKVPGLTPRPGRPSRPGGPRHCGRNEIYKTCGSPCQATCTTSNEPCNIVNIRCPDGCYCRDGFVRSGSAGKCIPSGACRGLTPVHPILIGNKYF